MTLGLLLSVVIVIVVGVVMLRRDGGWVQAYRNVTSKRFGGQP
jgi:hypothetical protein